MNPPETSYPRTPPSHRVGTPSHCVGAFCGQGPGRGQSVDVALVPLQHERPPRIWPTRGGPAVHSFWSVRGCRSRGAQPPQRGKAGEAGRRGGVRGILGRFLASLRRIASRRIVASEQPGRQACARASRRPRLLSIAFVILRACWARRLGDLGKILIGGGLLPQHGSGCLSARAQRALRQQRSGLH